MASHKPPFSTLRTCGLLLAVGLITAGCVSNGSTSGRVPTSPRPTGNATPQTPSATSNPFVGGAESSTSNATHQTPSAARNPFVSGSGSSGRSSTTTTDDSSMLDYYASRIPSNDQELRSEARMMLAAFTNEFYGAGKPITDASVVLRDGITPIATRFDSSGSWASIGVLIDRTPPSPATFRETVKKRLKQICQGQITFEVKDVGSGPLEEAKAIWSRCSIKRGSDIVTSTLVIARPAYGFWVLTINDPEKIVNDSSPTTTPRSSGRGHSSSNPFR